VDGIRDAIEYLGFHPRDCQSANDPTKLEHLTGKIRDAVRKIDGIQQLFKFLNRDNPPDLQAAHLLFEVDCLFMMSGPAFAHGQSG
jgi:hypothetical protein